VKRFFVILFLLLQVNGGSVAAAGPCPGPTLDWAKVLTNNLYSLSLAPDSTLHLAHNAPEGGFPRWYLERFNRQGVITKSEPVYAKWIFYGGIFVTVAAGRTNELYLSISESTGGFGFPSYHGSRIELYPTNVLTESPLRENSLVTLRTLYVEEDGGLTYGHFGNGISITHRSQSGITSFSALGIYPPVADLFGTYFSGLSTNGAPIVVRQTASVRSYGIAAMEVQDGIRELQ
jgi:hypothetical protein